jgi:hypothetical protein
VGRITPGTNLLAFCTGFGWALRGLSGAIVGLVALLAYPERAVGNNLAGQRRSIFGAHDFAEILAEALEAQIAAGLRQDHRNCRAGTAPSEASLRDREAPTAASNGGDRRAAARVAGAADGERQGIRNEIRPGRRCWNIARLRIDECSSSKCSRSRKRQHCLCSAQAPPVLLTFSEVAGIRWDRASARRFQACRFDHS